MTTEGTPGTDLFENIPNSDPVFAGAPQEIHGLRHLPPGHIDSVLASLIEAVH